MSFREKVCHSERKRTFGRKSVRNPGEKIMHREKIYVRMSGCLSERKCVKYYKRKIKVLLLLLLIILLLLFIVVVDVEGGTAGIRTQRN